MIDPTTIGVVTDIHGNSTALRAVLDDMPAVDELVCLGDVVGYGPNPGECVELIREHATVTLYGNHELFLSEPAMCASNTDATAGIQHALGTLTDDQLAWTQDLPYTTTICDGDVSLAHGHPNSETPYKYITKANATTLVPHSRENGWEYLAVGHSHIQFQLDLQRYHDDAGLLFNPGSVGQPRDKDPRAAYGVIHRDTRTVDLHRVEYNIERVVKQIRRAGLPSASGQRLRDGQHPQTNRL
jgi:predicted phosphodiesterase